MPQRHDRIEGGKREKTDCIAPSTDTLARIYHSSITAQDTRHQRSTISSDKVVATPLEASGVPGPSPALPHYLSTARRVAEPCARTTTPRFAHHHYNTHSHHMLARRVHHTHSQHVCNAQDIDSSGTPLPRSSLILQLSHRCLIPSSIAINSYHLCIFITHYHHTHTHTLQLFPYAVVSGDQPPRHTTRHVQHEEEVQSDEEPVSVSDTAPPGITEEEWDARLAFGTVTTRGKPARIGDGPTLCFCCGESGHTWIRCDKKKKGKCAVCGSQEHWTRQCDRRFRPHPTYLNVPAQKDPVRSSYQQRSSYPSSNNVPRANPVATSATQGTSKPFSSTKPVGLGEAKPGIPKNPKFNQAQAMQEKEVIPDGVGNSEEEMSESEKGSKSEESEVTLLQVRVSSTHQAEAPAWVHQRVVEQSSR